MPDFYLFYILPLQVVLSCQKTKADNGNNDGKEYVTPKSCSVSGLAPKRTIGQGFTADSIRHGQDFHCHRDLANRNYVLMLPQTLSDGITVTGYNSSDTVLSTFTTSRSMKFERDTMYSIVIPTQL